MNEGFHLLIRGDAVTLELGVIWWRVLAAVAVIVAIVKLVRYYRRRRREAERSPQESIRARFQDTMDMIMPWEDVEVEEEHQHDLPDELPVPLHHKIQLRHEGGVLPDAVEHIVLPAAGAVDVPERLPGQVFHGPVIVPGFGTDGDLVFRHGVSPYRLSMILSVSPNAGASRVLPQ